MNPCLGNCFAPILVPSRVPVVALAKSRLSAWVWVSFGPVARMLHASLWEDRSVKLPAINAGHEFAGYALQSAILGAWH